MIRFDTEGVEATRRIAAAVASVLEPGDVVLLEGELGAGKTAFTQGLAAALGVVEPVTSPTFTLMDVHPTAGFDLLHVDVYRLELLSEVVDLGLAEMLDDGAVAVVEWGDRAEAALRGDRLRIRLEATGETTRRISIEGEGPSWTAREAQLASGPGVGG